MQGSNMGATGSNHSTQATYSRTQAINAAQKSIAVQAPVEQVYELWARFEDLPKFITRLKKVRRIDDLRFAYTWSGRGCEDCEGVFQIVLQVPDRRIAWRTLSDGFMSGVVLFEPRSEQETEVTLKVRSMFDPPNLSQRLEEYLRNFKKLAESEEVVE